MTATDVREKKPLTVWVGPAYRGGKTQTAELWEVDPKRPHVVKVVYVHSRTAAWVALSRIHCGWFALCTRYAHTRESVLGEVPICAECDAKMDRLAGGTR